MAVALRAAGQIQEELVASLVGVRRLVRERQRVPPQMFSSSSGTLARLWSRPRCLVLDPGRAVI